MAPTFTEVHPLKALYLCTALIFNQMTSDSISFRHKHLSSLFSLCVLLYMQVI